MFSELYISEIKLHTTPDKLNYISNLPVVRYLIEKNSIKLNNKVTFLVGENGTGKSTLIEAIAVAFGFNAEGGSKNFSFSTADAHSTLHEHLLLVKSNFAKDGFFLRAESYFNAASYIDELDKIPAFSANIKSSYGGKSLHNQSHGESFLALVQNRFGGDGLYILDEPEAALSPMKLLTLMSEIDHLVKKNSQFIIATHSPVLITFPGAEILQLSNTGINSVGYKDTEHYQLTKGILDNPDRYLKYLFD